MCVGSICSRNTQGGVPVNRSAFVIGQVAVASLVLTGIVLALVLPLIFPDASTFIVGGLPAFLIVGGGAAS